MSPVRERVFTAYGAIEALMFDCRAPEVVVSGPAGTGKTRGCLEYLHKCALQYPGMRGLIARKTATSLAGSALVTFTEKVLDPADGVTFFGGNRIEPPAFRYPNRSRLVVGGLDKPTKILSAEYDLIYVNQAEELTQADWETLTTRARYGVLPWQQVFGDCNPGPPTHWLKQRADAGQLVMLESRHEDNPAVTPEYLATLDRLTGVRYFRYRKGLWVAAEGMVYDGWDPAVHLIDPFPIPATWPRYWAVDFGYTNPFVCQWWARDPDGRLYRYRELYMTGRIVRDHARHILRAVGAWDEAVGRPSWGQATEPAPRAVICDHDAEDRATLEREIGLPTITARKAISPGIQAVQARLQMAGDGKPRLYLVRGALLERDAALVEAIKPACTEEEVESYVWDTTGGRRKGEQPVDQHNHGMDALRYLVAHFDVPDQEARQPAIAAPLIVGARRGA